MTDEIKEYVKEEDLNETQLLQGSCAVLSFNGVVLAFDYNDFYKQFSVSDRKSTFKFHNASLDLCREEANKYFSDYE